MAFGLAACHRPRGACAARGLAERGSPPMLAHPSAGCRLFPLLPSRCSEQGSPIPVRSQCVRSHTMRGQRWRSRRGGLASPTSAGESPNMNFHSRCVSVTSSRRKESFPSPMSCEEPEGCRVLVVSTEPSPGLEAGSVHGAEPGREADPAGRGAQRLCDMRVTITPLACTHIRDTLTLREEQKKGALSVRCASEICI